MKETFLLLIWGVDKRTNKQGGTKLLRLVTHFHNLKFSFSFRSGEQRTYVVRIGALEVCGIWDLGSGIWDLGSGVWGLGSGVIQCDHGGRAPSWSTEMTSHRGSSGSSGSERRDLSLGEECHH